MVKERPGSLTNEKGCCHVAHHATLSHSSTFSDHWLLLFHKGDSQKVALPTSRKQISFEGIFQDISRHIEVMFRLPLFYRSKL